MKKSKNNFIAFAASISLIMIIVVLIISFAKDDWTESYSTDSSKPFGLEIFDKELNNILKNKKISRSNNWNYFRYSQYDTLPSKTLIYFNTSIDREYLEEIYETLENHEVFIIAKAPFNYVNDSIYTYKEIKYVPNPKRKDSLKFTNPELKKFNSAFIYKSDFENINLIGHTPEILSKLNSTVTFQRFKIKNNYLYLCYTPQVFTNHYLKNNTLAYPSAILSYIKNEEVIFYNEGFKYENIDEEYQSHDKSILYFILENKYLKIAFYLFLFGCVSFTFFKAKRVQRIIPVLPKNKNRSIEFIKTIANLYYNSGNNLGIIHKMNQQFLNKVEAKFHLKTDSLDNNFVIQLARYSNQDYEFVNQVITKLKYYNATHFNPTQEEVNQHYINLKKISY